MTGRAHWTVPVSETVSNKFNDNNSSGQGHSCNHSNVLLFRLTLKRSFVKTRIQNEFDCAAVNQTVKNGNKPAVLEEQVPGFASDLSVTESVANYPAAAVNLCRLQL